MFIYQFSNSFIIKIFIMKKKNIPSICMKLLLFQIELTPILINHKNIIIIQKMIHKNSLLKKINY